MEHEVILDKNAFLVSETDQNGIIKFANDEFCKLAGFSIDELIGKPHNVVRHPDMPDAAFKDMWETITAGNTWKGFVKNKTKDGGFYWVFATAYPYISCDGSHGYISCRKFVSEQEKSKYTKIYKSMR